MNNQKKIVTIVTIVAIIIASIGIAYAAAMTYSRSGTYTNKLIAGDIYMQYKENNQLTIENALPTSTYDNTKYFEFNITGKNESDKDIWYEITLARGDNHATRTTRLQDKFLRFTLFKGNTKVIDGASYDSIVNQRIYTEYINANTNADTTTTYKLYVWIDESVTIGNTAGVDYQTNVWNNQVYASIKVNVNARTETNSSCFTTTVINETQKTVSVKWAYDSNCEKDVIIPQKINGYTVTELNNYAFAGAGLTSVVLPDTITTIPMYAFVSNQLTSVHLGKNVTSIGAHAFNINKLTGISLPESLTRIEAEAFNSAFDNESHVSVIIPNNVVEIGNWAFISTGLSSVKLSENLQIIGERAFSDNQLTSLVIPDSVTTIGYQAFSGNKLTSVILGNRVATIGDDGFSFNQLTSIVIPNSVVSIGSNAFDDNKLTSVILGNHVTTIGAKAFAGSSFEEYGPNQLSSVTIPSSVTSWYCDSFADGVTITNNSNVACTE